MENRKEKVALNDELLDKVSGGTTLGDFFNECPSCHTPLDSDGNCPNEYCPLSVYYPPYVTINPKID